MKGKSKPAKKGQLVTSEHPLTIAAPVQAPVISGQLVGGFPALFGVGTGKGKAKKSGKPSRRKMY